MKSFLVRRRPSPALIISVVALFVALSGTSYAVSKVGSKQLRNNAVTSNKLRKNAVTESKIRKNAVTSNKIKADAVTGADIRESSLRKVPDADKLDGQDASAFETSNRYHRVSVISLGSGESRPFLSVGPFSFTAKCAINDGGNDRGLIVIATTQNGSAFDGDGNSFGLAENFGPQTSEASRSFLLAETTTGDGAINAQADGVAVAPDGTQLVAKFWAAVNTLNQPGRCQFGGLVQTV